MQTNRMLATTATKRKLYADSLLFGRITAQDRYFKKIGILQGFSKANFTTLGGS